MEIIKTVQVFCLHFHRPLVTFHLPPVGIIQTHQVNLVWGSFNFKQLNLGFTHRYFSSRNSHRGYRSTSNTRILPSRTLTCRISELFSIFVSLDLSFIPSNLLSPMHFILEFIIPMVIGMMEV